MKYAIFVWSSLNKKIWGYFIGGLLLLDLQLFVGTSNFFKVTNQYCPKHLWSKVLMIFTKRPTCLFFTGVKSHGARVSEFIRFRFSVRFFFDPLIPSSMSRTRFTRFSATCCLTVVPMPRLSEESRSLQRLVAADGTRWFAAIFTFADRFMSVGTFSRCYRQNSQAFTFVINAVLRICASSNKKPFTFIINESVYFQHRYESYNDDVNNETSMI